MILKFLKKRGGKKNQISKIIAQFECDASVQLNPWILYSEELCGTDFHLMSKKSQSVEEDTKHTCT